MPFHGNQPAWDEGGRDLIAALRIAPAPPHCASLPGVSRSLLLCCTRVVIIIFRLFRVQSG